MSRAIGDDMAMTVGVTCEPGKFKVINEINKNFRYKCKFSGKNRV